MQNLIGIVIHKMRRSSNFEVLWGIILKVAIPKGCPDAWILVEAGPKICGLCSFE